MLGLIHPASGEFLTMVSRLESAEALEEVQPVFQDSVVSINLYNALN